MPARPSDLVDTLSSLGLVPKGAAWHALQGGQTNCLWQVDGATGPVVVKLFQPGRATPLFPNDPTQEAMMLRCLAREGLAPDLLYEGRCGLGPVLIYAHQDGMHWDRDGARAGRLLRRLHQRPPIKGLRSLPGGSAMIEAQVQEMWRDLPPVLQAQLDRLQPHSPVAAAQAHTLLHGDPVPGNLLIAAQPAQDMLIDWQCPAIGDPVEDLALFLSPAMQQIYRGRALTKTEQTAFLAGYDDDTLRPRLAAMTPWHHWRMAAYCGWKAAQGSAAYATALPLELTALQHSADHMQ